MPGAFLEPSRERVETTEHRAHARDGVDPEVWTGPMRGEPLGLDLEADESPVRVHHQRAPATRAARDRDHIWPTGSGLRDHNIETGPVAPFGNEARELDLARRARDETRVDRVDRNERRRQLSKLTHTRTSYAPS